MEEEEEDEAFSDRERSHSVRNVLSKKECSMIMMRLWRNNTTSRLGPVLFGFHAQVKHVVHRIDYTRRHTTQQRDALNTHTNTLHSDTLLRGTKHFKREHC